MLELQTKQRGIIIKHYNDYGWCIRGWNRHSGGKNAGCKRKGKRFIINSANLTILKQAMQLIINKELDNDSMITLRQNGITLYIKANELAIKSIENNKSSQKYIVELTEDTAKKIINQLNKIKTNDICTSKES